MDSGKTTFCNELQKMIITNGGECYIEGTDKYCTRGIDPRGAASCITNELKKAKDSKAELIVVIIDTCGDRAGKNIFGHYFNEWNRHDIFINLPSLSPPYIKQYLCWSLRNVINRPVYTCNSSYYLNPCNASIQTCIDVHTKKAQSFLHNKFIKVTSNNDRTSILNDINSFADEYQDFLDTQYPLKSTIEDIYNKFIKN